MTQVDNTLRLYAIVRGDIEMSTGKIVSQAGHAFLEAFLRSSNQEEYRSDGIGTKVTLQSKSLDDLLWAQYVCEQMGLSHALIEDSGQVMPPDFDGSPIITALGIGPIKRDDVKKLTKKFKLL